MSDLAQGEGWWVGGFHYGNWLGFSIRTSLTFHVEPDSIMSFNPIICYPSVHFQVLFEFSVAYLLIRLASVGTWKLMGSSWWLSCYDQPGRFPRLPRFSQSHSTTIRRNSSILSQRLSKTLLESNGRHRAPGCTIPKAKSSSLLIPEFSWFFRFQDSFQCVLLLCPIRFQTSFKHISSIHVHMSNPVPKNVSPCLHPSTTPRQNLYKPSLARGYPDA